MSKFSIGTFTAPAKENEWIDDVNELAQATEANSDASATFTVPVKDEGRTLSDIRAAAKLINKTVRIRVRNDEAVTKTGTKENGKAILSGDVTLTISLTEKYKDGRGRPRKAVEGAEAAPVETPAKGK